MYKKGSNNRILIGTAYILNAFSPEQKALVVSTFAAASYLPFECLLLPTLEKDQFKTAFEQSVSLSDAYVLLIGPYPQIYPDYLTSCIETELDSIKKMKIESKILFIYIDYKQHRQKPTSFKC